VCDVQGLKQRCARESRCFPPQIHRAPHSALAHLCKTSVSGQCTNTLHRLLSTEAGLQHPAREQSHNFTSRAWAATRSYSHSVTFIDGKLTQDNLCLTDCLWDGELERERERNKEKERISPHRAAYFLCQACIIRCVVKSAELRGTDFPPLQGDTNRLLKGKSYLKSLQCDVFVGYACLLFFLFNLFT